MEYDDDEKYNKLKKRLADSNVELDQALQKLAELAVVCLTVCTHES